MGNRRPSQGRPPGRDSATSPGQYVYGVIRYPGKLSFGARGLGQEPTEVRLVRYRDLAAVVSDTPLGVLEPTRENVLAHERVNQQVLENHTIVPMSFGTVFKSRADVLELLRSAYDTFGRALDAMAGKIELGLEVRWDPEREAQRIHSQDEALCRSGEAIEAGGGFASRMEYGRLVDAALEARAGEYSTKVLAGLREVSVASRVNEAVGARTILKAAFLVLREKRAAFERRLRTLDTRYENLTFRVTGPWPPYHFVSIRLKIAEEGGAP